MNCILRGMEYYKCEIEFKNIEENFDRISAIENEIERVKELHTTDNGNE